MVVVKLDGPALLCKTDEVGELCLSANFTGTGYWGLPGVTSASFKVRSCALYVVVIPSPPLDNIRIMVTVWRLRGNIIIIIIIIIIIRTALCWIVWHNVHSLQHTYVSSSYRSNRLGLSHWDPHALRRGGCLELYYCNMVEWFWWDSSLVSTTNWFPSVLWHCWFGHLARKNCPQNDLLCVEWDVKPYTLNHSLGVRHTHASARRFFSDCSCLDSCFRQSLKTLHSSQCARRIRGVLVHDNNQCFTYLLTYMWNARQPVLIFPTLQPNLFDIENSNSNSAETLENATIPQVSSSYVYSFGSYRVDKQTNRQTDAAENTQCSSLRYDVA